MERPWCHGEGWMVDDFIAGPGNPPNLGREAPNWMVQLHHFLWQHMYFGGIPMYCVRDVRLLVSFLMVKENYDEDGDELMN